MKTRSVKVITVITAAIMLLSLCSCGSGIKGTWQLTSVTIGDVNYDMEQLADAVGSGASSDVSVLLVINGDGTFTLTDDEDSDSGETGTYEEKDGELLIGGYGGIYRYRSTNPFVTDYSLNVVNAESCRQLHKLGAKRVTLSYELNKNQIRDLAEAYRDANGGYPALEMIVYGRAPLLFTKYCPLKKMGQCGLCKKHSYELKDEYGEFPVLSHDDCTTTILNGKILNLLDEMRSVNGVEAFRLNFTIESADEVKRIIGVAQKKLDGTLEKSVFRQKTDTRGHFNKEIL